MTDKSSQLDFKLQELNFKLEEDSETKRGKWDTEIINGTSILPWSKKGVSFPENDLSNPDVSAPLVDSTHTLNIFWGNFFLR